MIDQNYLRKCVTKIKWESDIDYREIAEELLSIKYRSFLNWKKGTYNLSEEKAKILLDYVECLIDEDI